MLRLGSIAFVVAVACGPGVQHPTGQMLQGNVPTGVAGTRLALPDGDYACTLTSGGYTYQPYLCRVATSDGVTRLVKLEGSQRVRGTLTFGSDANAQFHGEFYCAIGGCNRPIEAVLAQTAPHTWAGGIGEDDALSLVYQPAGMYGGASYGAGFWGDDGLGGDGYGGGGYGGDGYGGL